MKKEFISIGGRSVGRSLLRAAIIDINNAGKKLCSLGVTVSSKQKKAIKKLLNMDHPKTNSFNLVNATAQDLRAMIESEQLPAFLNSFQKNRIVELYSKGNQWDAVRKLQSLIDEQNAKPGKTLL